MLVKRRPYILYGYKAEESEHWHALILCELSPNHIPPSSATPVMHSLVIVSFLGMADVLCDIVIILHDFMCMHFCEHDYYYNNDIQNHDAEEL